MIEITVDLRGYDSRRQIHEYLKGLLPFPGYFGNNLDALHDVLTSVTEDARITVFGGENAKQKSFIRVMEDSAEENPHIFLDIQACEAAED